jgi:DNA-directed RNA polymerase specialized sigma24 family protein
MKTTDPAADARYDPVVLAALEHYRSWLGLLARLQVEPRFRAKFDPSDIVQQTMLEAVRDWPKFRGGTEAELAPWLRQILAHVLLHEMRRFGGAQRRDIVWWQYEARRYGVTKPVTGRPRPPDEQTRHRPETSGAPRGKRPGRSCTGRGCRRE